MKSFEELRETARLEWESFASPGKLRVLVGSATCGRAAGSLEVLKAFQNELGKHSLETETALVEVGCLGACYAEVLVEVRGRDGRRVLYSGVDPRYVPKLVESHLVHGEPVLNRAFAVMDGAALDGVPSFEQMPMLRHQVRIVLRNCGIIDPGNIRHYIGRGGYSGLLRALGMKPEDVTEEVKTSGLRGRGGAGFPTGVKWSFARKSPGDVKYVICNADEGDPGAFMDRSVLEGLVIAGYAIGASMGYVYCRAEYPLAVERIQAAIAQMHENGLLGESILGSKFSFDIQLKKGAGAFVCGEETALMQSVEGRRGMPRSRPPFPAVSGLFGKPTNINNVETLAAVSAILEKSGKWYAEFGTEKSRGTKTFALAGKIKRTGLIEVPMGIPLRTVIEEIGGGVLTGKKFKAVQTGGPSGGCIPSKHIDIPVDYEHLAEVGSIMGSGGMVVIDDSSCMVEVARYFLTFTENESCGKCVPCRMGTQHLLRMLTDITEGRGSAEQIETMKMIGDTMKKASLCGLGQTASNPVTTTLEYFEDEYRAHIEHKKCPAGVCREIIHFSIDEETCNGCRACVTACPIDAITGELKHVHVINQELCIHCGSCRDACKFDAVHVE
jgi:NADH:ubiquinone oxidoreductase subunit F (NADH-binding)/(2Fe-2S) ferredoxin